jgi:hypothetical protein
MAASPAGLCRFRGLCLLMRMDSWNELLGQQEMMVHLDAAVDDLAAGVVTRELDCGYPPRTKDATASIVGR